MRDKRVKSTELMVAAPLGSVKNGAFTIDATC